MTRREWLKLNPPPKAAGTLRELLEQLTQENLVRQQLEQHRGAWQQSLTFWQGEVQRAHGAGDTVKLGHAQAQLADAQTKVSDADKQLASTVQLPARISTLTAELSRAATCPTHKRDLHRHKNRPEDLFLCDVGPHFFLWTKNGAGGALAPVELSKPLPDIDGAMEWI
jgi:hypothetical protein